MSEHQLRVALVWNGTVFHEKTFTQTSDHKVRVGEDPKNQFSVPADSIPETFEMFERTNSGYKFRFTSDVDGTFTIGDEEFDVEELSAEKGTTKSGKTFETDLSPGDWGIVDLGDVNIFFQLMERGEVVAGRGVGSIEGAVVGWIGISAVAHIAFLIIAHMFFQIDPNLEDLENLNRFAKIMVDDVDDPLEEEEQDEPEEDTTGKKAGGEEGKFGDPDEEIPESKIPKVDGEMVDEIDVKNIGINKALSSDVLGSGALKNIFQNQEGFDSKMNVAMSGEGGELQVGRGAGGMGLSGVGKGGGGEGFGRIGGLGKVDTGGGKGTGAKLGKKKKKSVKAKMRKGAPKIGNFCDKGDIRRVVGRKSNAIKYCFEKQLQTNPKLSGKVIAQWKVGLDGKVMSASIVSSTIGSKPVSGCVARVIKRMRFQKPNGGICVIKYPFVFSGLE